MSESFAYYPVESIPLTALKGEARDCRRQANLYRQAAAREEMHAAMFEAEIARREAT